jgi:hypothetical protein
VLRQLGSALGEQGPSVAVGFVAVAGRVARPFCLDLLQVPKLRVPRSCISCKSLP